MAIIEQLGYLKVGVCWVPQLLTDASEGQGTQSPWTYCTHMIHAVTAPCHCHEGWELGPHL